MFVAHPFIIASRTAAFRLVPQGNAALPWNYGNAADGAALYEPMPLSEVPAMPEAAGWPGPLAYFGRHCDEGAFCRPLAEDPGLPGLTFSVAEYAANAAILAAEKAALDELQRRQTAFHQAVAAWYAANRDTLLAIYPGGYETDRWLEARWLDANGRLRREFGLPENGYPYVRDANFGPQSVGTHFHRAVQRARKAV